jgi:hypothetical protein
MSNNKQQTTVEWYNNQLRKVFSNTTEASNFSHEELLQQAKEMEKEQKADTWNNAINAVEKDKWESFEQFYAQTYGGNK